MIVRPASERRALLADGEARYRAEACGLLAGWSGGAEGVVDQAKRLKSPPAGGSNSRMFCRVAAIPGRS
ncbi:MAG: hypothetical protein EXQ91_04050 [Alphaproteobacteria bacterium]|nr:hypothetical protein [Alphaproteobacteria bacterium]